MATKGEQTRERILDAAQALILDRGFGGVSIDRVIGELDMTKGAFFHHFRNKKELARALIERYADDGVTLFESNLERAKKLSDDPLQQLLIFVGLYEELFESLTDPYPGCLLASYAYEMQLFDDDIKPIVNKEFYLSRRELTALIERIAEKYPPGVSFDARALADMFMSTFEGAFVLEKSFGTPQITAEQLRLYKTFISTLFTQH
ncbi:MAG: TetR/AcrR family transcriptional regulator [Gammaproteobacteria bacterium]